MMVVTLVLLLATLTGAPVEGQWRRRFPPLDPCRLPYPPRRCSDPSPYLPRPPPTPVDNYDGYSMFVFGDSFADTGNLPYNATSLLAWSLMRPWHIPYGSSYGKDDGSVSSTPQATGRFSNYKVQTDFVATILGLKMAPPAHQVQGDASCDNTGMTFAMGGSGVYSVPAGVPTLSAQVDTFAQLVSSGAIPAARLAKSVALVAVSGTDYDRVGIAHPKAFGDVTAFIRNVTAGISDSVDRLLKLGVKKVLVNNLPPIGCAPSQTKAAKYGACDDAGNIGADTHNKILKQLLGDQDNVLVVDLHAAFSAIVQGSTGQFKHRLTPCCVADSFCGATDANGDLYEVCTTPSLGLPGPEEYFYWDDMNPTQAGWAAVMEQVEGSIKQFVGVN
ncbi:hypothetical protein CFC21_084800 [Triticum aestivum]|uniref:GDSL esterase/lipase n=3 Tax=Triticum TaxID=4564 RepID=A0A9R1B3L7_TRITD|nr:GDSL esterase/lipase At5g03610-like [Triticum aestivum]KAF7080784.1 hypothetical protein CFC21_084800 [Triticum aestivum]VAI50215.1 unnamed protein product [Triticum turgidum subsp. durum]